MAEKIKQYVGKAPLTLVKAGDRFVYVYANAPLPVGVADEDVARLLEGDFIVEGAVSGFVLPAPSAEVTRKV